MKQEKLFVKYDLDPYQEHVHPEEKKGLRTYIMFSDVALCDGCDRKLPIVHLDIMSYMTTPLCHDCLKAFTREAFLATVEMHPVLHRKALELTRKAITSFKPKSEFYENFEKLLDTYGCEFIYEEFIQDLKKTEYTKMGGLYARYNQKVDSIHGQLRELRNRIKKEIK